MAPQEAARCGYPGCGKPVKEHGDTLEERLRTTPSLLERLGVHTIRQSVRMAHRP